MAGLPIRVHGAPSAAVVEQLQGGSAGDNAILLQLHGDVGAIKGVSQVIAARAGFVADAGEEQL